MSNEQARSGFKTFIITLCVSLVVFGALYYFVSDSSTKVSDIESKENKVSADVKPEQTGETVFGTIASVNVNTEHGAVLAGATESTESSVVPETGSNEIFGILMSLIAFSFAG